MIRCHQVTPAGQWAAAIASVALDYDARLIRRRRLSVDSGAEILVDLPSVTHLNDGDAFLLTDGTHIEICAAEEPLLRVTGDHLPRLAWHIGNRHTPCEIHHNHLLIRQDRVLADMLIGLGAQVEAVEMPFSPEGGAYGHGRTMGHSHDHGHDHGHP